MKLPTVDELVAGLDQKRQSDVEHAENRLFMPFRIEKLVPRLVAAFPRIKSWRGRNAVLFELIPFAQKREDVLKLALVGLSDPAFLVRMQSCIILAQSQRADLIPHLEVLLDHKDGKTREYARVATNHIKSKTLFYDFSHLDRK